MISIIEKENNDDELITWNEINMHIHIYQYQYQYFSF
jgi:hypothetical protein